MAEQKKNDWLATVFFSPDKTPEDLYNLGITTENSSLQDEDYYKNIPQIQEKFKTDSGKFDDKGFHEFYNTVLAEYNIASNEQFTNTVANNYSYDPFDMFAPVGGRKKDVAPRIVTIKNSGRQSHGLTNLFETSASTMSIREIAQTKKVFNPETNQFEDWTPNDKGGLTGFLRPTLVMAQWDSDGVSVIDGREVAHKAGDLKYDEDGDPYYELLGNRSIAGKDVLHYEDTLTVDGSSWNKYDFFDSDGLDKSVTGTVAKTVAKLAPMFVPGVNMVYGGISAVMELGKLLPIMEQTVEGLISGDLSNSKSSALMNKTRGWFSQFDSSVSDYGRNSFWNVENIGEIAASSGVQLFQQRVIGEIPLMVSKLAKLPMSDGLMKLGRNLSWTYMAGTSSTEAYDAFKQAGCNDRVAGLGMIATMGAMGTLFRQDYFRDFWYKNSYLDNTGIRSVVRDSAKQIGDKVFAEQAAAEAVTPKGAAKVVKTMQNLLTENFKKLKSSDLGSSALNEGLEEVMEEASSDAVKGFFSGLNALGLIDSGKDYDFGINMDDIIARYSSSFFGGAIGGTVFGAYGKWEGRNQVDDAIDYGGDHLKELTYLLQQGKRSQIEKELDRLHKKGALLSTSLSGKEYDVVGENIRFKPAKPGESQNDIVYNQLKDYINRIDGILSEEGLKLNEAELQQILRISKETGLEEEDVKRLMLENKKAEYQTNITDQIIESGLHSQIFEDWNELSTKIVAVKNKIEKLLKPSEGEGRTEKDFDVKLDSLKNNPEYKELKKELDDLRKQRDEIVDGKRNGFYVGQMQFAVRKNIVDNFVEGFGIHNYCRLKFGKDYDSLDDIEKLDVDEAYKIFSTTTEKKRVIDAHALFTQMQENTKQSIVDAAKNMKNEQDLFIAGSTETGLMNLGVDDLIEEKQKQIEEKVKELPEGQETSEEIEELKLQIKDLEEQRGEINKSKYGSIAPALSQNGRTILKRTQEGNTDLNAFEEYASSYNNFLDYSISKGYHTDLVDTDFYRIVNDYVELNNLSELTRDQIAERIQNATGSDKELANGFASHVKQIISYIKNGDINEAIRLEQNLESQIDDVNYETGTNYNVSGLKEILPHVGGKNVFDYLKEIQSKKAKMKNSPIYDILAKANEVAGTDSWNVLDLIKQQELGLLSVKDIDDFVIKDGNILTKLRETSKLIDSVAALLDASVHNGYNDTINVYREKNNYLPSLSTEEILLLNGKLAQIKNQLNNLIEIAERNGAQKLKEQKDIEYNMRKKFAAILAKPDSLTKKKFASEFGIDNIDQIISECNIPNEVNDDNYDDYMAAMVKFETKIYETVKSKNLSEKDIAAKLMNIFDANEIVKGIPTKLSKDENTEISEYDKLMYLTSVIGYPMQNFYNRYKTVITNPEFKLAPIYAQETAVRMMVSNIESPNLFNAVVDLIAEKNIELNQDDDYLTTKTILHNLIITFGGAGVGKTAGCAAVVKMMYPNADVITCTPTEKQLKRLNESLHHEGQSFTKNNFIAKITDHGIEKNDYEMVNGKEDVIAAHLKSNFAVKHDNIFGTGDIHFVFIDEISLYDRFDLEAITKWAYENNVIIIGLGDYKQLTSKRNIEVTKPNGTISTEVFETGLEDCISTRTPNLIAPLRPDYVVKYDNYMMLSDLLDKAYNKLFNEPSISDKELNVFVNSLLRENNLRIKYYEDDNLFVGSKIIKKDDIKFYINKFKKLSNDVCIVTDEPSKYSQYVQDGIQVRKIEDVQGDEFDYIIVDSDFSKDSLVQLKSFYTLSQRSKKGSVFNSFSLRVFKNTVGESGKISMDESQKEKSRKWKIDSLKKIPTKEIQFARQGVTLNRPATATTQNGNTSSGNISGTTTSGNTTNGNTTGAGTSTPTPTTTTSTGGMTTGTNTTEVVTTTTPATVLEEFSEPGNPIAQDVTEEEYKHNVKQEHLSQRTYNVGGKQFNAVVSTAETSCEMFREGGEVDQWIKDSNTGLKQFLENKIPDPEKLRDILQWFRAYYVYGYYKQNTEEEKANHDKAVKYFEKTITNWIREKNCAKKLIELIKSPSELYFENPKSKDFNDRGLLVARHTIDGKIVNIPLLITEAGHTGKYTGNIRIASKFRFIKSDKTYDFEKSSIENTEINTSNLFRIYETPIVLSASDTDILSYPTDQQEWIKRNNGKTFFIATGDPFLTDDDILEKIKPAENFSLTLDIKDKKIAIFGGKYRVTFDELMQHRLLFTKPNHELPWLTGTTAGNIIALAYDVNTDVVKDKCRRYLSTGIKKGYSYAIRFTYNENNEKVEKICTTPEEVEAFLKFNGVYDKKSFSSIVLGWMAGENKFKYNYKGEENLNTIFGYGTEESFTDTEMFVLKSKCTDAHGFMFGIYGQDKTDEHFNDSVYYSAYTNKIVETTYCTDRKCIGNNFVLDFENEVSVIPKSEIPAPNPVNPQPGSPELRTTIEPKSETPKGKPKTEIVQEVVELSPITSPVNIPESQVHSTSGNTTVKQQNDIHPALSISKKTAEYGVTIDSKILSNYRSWLQANPNGIVAYRVNRTAFNTAESVENGIIGNPFDWQVYGTNEAVKMFYDWLTTGNNFGEKLATPEFRTAVVNKLLSTETPNILYYKELNMPSHATVIGYLINNKQLLKKDVSNLNPTTVAQIQPVVQQESNLNESDIVNKINEKFKEWGTDRKIGKYDETEIKNAINYVNTLIKKEVKTTNFKQIEPVYNTEGKIIDLKLIEKTDPLLVIRAKLYRFNNEKLNPIIERIKNKEIHIETLNLENRMLTFMQDEDNDICMIYDNTNDKFIKIVTQPEEQDNLKEMQKTFEIYYSLNVFISSLYEYIHTDEMRHEFKTFIFSLFDNESSYSSNLPNSIKEILDTCTNKDGVYELLNNQDYKFLEKVCKELNISIETNFNKAMASLRCLTWSRLIADINGMDSVCSF